MAMRNAPDFAGGSGVWNCQNTCPASRSPQGLSLYRKGGQGWVRWHGRAADGLVAATRRLIRAAQQRPPYHMVGLSCRSTHFSRRGATNSSTHPGVSVTFLDVSGWAKNVSVCLTDVSVTVTFVSVSGIFVSVSLPDVSVRPTFVSVTDVDVSVRGVDVCSRLLDDVYGAHGYVHEQDANRFHPGWRRRGIFDVVHAGNSTVTRVPPPGVDSTALRPASSLARAARFFKPRPFPFCSRC